MPVDLIVVAAILVLQPLLAVLYAYAVARLFVRFTSRTTGRWADNRIEKAKDAAESLAGGED